MHTDKNNYNHRFNGKMNVLTKLAMERNIRACLGDGWRGREQARIRLHATKKLHNTL
jgi:hypothetical protein